MQTLTQIKDDGRIRLLLAIQSLELGGSERQCVEMARLLAGDGFAVTVACLRKKGPLLARLRESGIPVVEFSVQSLQRPHAFYQMARFAAFLRRNSFQVVHANDLYANLFAVPVARLMKVPVVISSQRDLSHSEWYTPARRKVLRRVQGLSTWILVNSEAIRSYLVNDDGLDAAKIRVMYNTIETSRFWRREGRSAAIEGVASGDRLIAMIANMHTDVKGHPDLIAAAAAICKAHANAKILLVGDGKVRREFEQQVRALGLDKSVLFLGHRTDVANVLSSCEIGVLSSRAEGLPNVVLEYMATGLATVATEVGGVPEIVQHEVNGLLVPVRDSAALASAVNRLLDDDGLRTQIANAGRESVFARFDSATFLHALKELYRLPSSINVAATAENNFAVE